MPGRINLFLTKYVLAVVLVTGLLARVIMTLGSRGILWPDSMAYYGSGLAIAEELDFGHHPIYRVPLYPAWLALFLVAGQTPEIGALTIIGQRVLGLLSTIFFYQIARRVFNPTTAFFTGLWFTLHTLQLYYETCVETEVLFVFLLSATLWYALKVLDECSIRQYLIAGFLCALLTLTRSVGQLFVFFPLLVLVGYKIRPRKKAAIACASILTAFILPLLPWLLINHQTYGFWGMSRAQGMDLYYRVLDLDGLSPLEPSAYPEVKEIDHRQREKSGGASVYFETLTALKRAGFSDLETDQMMFGFAVETLRAHPWEFTHNTITQFYKSMARVRNSVHLSDSEKGPYLSNGKNYSLSLPAFPGGPKHGNAWARRLVAWFFTHGRIPMAPVLFLCAAGLVLYFRSHQTDRVHGLLLLGTVLYFNGLTSIFNAHEDRFRLLFDPILFMFAVWAVGELGRYPNRFLRFGGRSWATTPWPPAGRGG